mmetsp:Transcript_11068/g.18856  ORF Transcript_11068/g.18856 Transcript_11068/m.18856 type:complete len:104 (+) Transcript_11068:1623-1934(+)
MDERQIYTVIMYLPRSAHVEWWRKSSRTHVGIGVDMTSKQNTGLRKGHFEMASDMMFCKVLFVIAIYLVCAIESPDPSRAIPDPSLNTFCDSAVALSKLVKEV